METNTRNSPARIDKHTMPGYVGVGQQSVAWKQGNDWAKFKVYHTIVQGWMQCTMVWCSCKYVPGALPYFHIFSWRNVFV